MSDYIEREAAIKAISTAMGKVDRKIMCDRLMSIPAADVRPVVLCGECKNFSLNSCMRWADGTFMERTDFCSRGVKREKS